MVDTRSLSSEAKEALRPQQERDLQNLIETKTPDPLGLPYDLWTRGAVRELVAQ